MRFFRKRAKKGKIFKNLGKNVQNFFFLKKKGQAHVCDYHTHETARTCPV